MHLKKTKGKLTMNIKITFCVAICSKKKNICKNNTTCLNANQNR